MEIVEETSSKLILQANNFSWFWFLWFLLFPLGLGGIMLLFLFNAGVTTLSCQRVEPTLIDCEKSEAKLLGLIPGESTFLRQVKTAKYNSRTYTDREYWVSVITNAGEIVVFEDFISVNEVKGDRRAMEAIAVKINEFMLSNEPLLKVSYDRRWKLHNLFDVLFLAIAVLCLCFLLKWNVIETYTLDRHAQILRYKQRKLLGVQTKRYPLKEIKAVEIEKTLLTVNDEEMYKAILLLPSASKNRVEIYFGELKKVDILAQKISDFTGISLISSHIN